MAVSNQVEPEWKLCAVKEYLEGRTSLNKVAEKYGISRCIIQITLMSTISFVMPLKNISIFIITRDTRKNWAV